FLFYQIEGGKEEDRGMSRRTMFARERTRSRKETSGVILDHLTSRKERDKVAGDQVVLRPEGVFGHCTSLAGLEDGDVAIAIDGEPDRVGAVGGGKIDFHVTLLRREVPAERRGVSPPVERTRRKTRFHRCSPHRRAYAAPLRCDIGSVAPLTLLFLELGFQLGQVILPLVLAAGHPLLVAGERLVGESPRRTVCMLHR